VKRPEVKVPVTVFAAVALFVRVRLYWSWFFDKHALPRNRLPNLLHPELNHGMNALTWLEKVEAAPTV